MAGRLHVGTSGWHYASWRGPFYPEKYPPAKFLPYYARHFDAVEINNSFYRMPTEATFKAWADTAPDDFTFAVKASRFVTHMKKLAIDPATSLLPFFERLAPLGDKLGPILFQLPPRWRFNPERLAGFLRLLPPGYRYTFEFRHESWLVPEATALLAAHGAAFCIYHLAGFQSPITVTADFVYIRLHGPGGAYQGSYDDQALAWWAGAMREWQAEGLDVYCFFDNDEQGFAAIDALRLQRLLRPGGVPLRV